MERMVEGSVQRLFRSPIQPAEIARRLERAMESQQTISVDRVIVPSVYRAFLHPEDFKAFDAIQEALEREMASYLRDLAQERGFSLLEHPTVDVAADPAVPRRGIQVVAEMSMGNAQAQQPQAPDRTQVMNTVDATQARIVSAFLVLQTADGEHRFPLETGLLTIGRALSNDVIVEDPRVSRQHAQIRYRARRYFVGDTGSTNGTYLNGTAVTTEQPLRTGDTVSFGGLEMRFEQQ